MKDSFFMIAAACAWTAIGVNAEIGAKDQLSYFCFTCAVVCSATAMVLKALKS